MILVSEPKAKNILFTTLTIVPDRTSLIWALWPHRLYGLSTFYVQFFTVLQLRSNGLTDCLYFIRKRQQDFNVLTPMYASA